MVNNQLISIKTKDVHGGLSETMRGEIQTMFERLEPHVSANEPIKVNVTKNKKNFTVKVSAVMDDNHHVRSCTTDEEFYEALNKAYCTIEQQMIEHKHKRISLKKKLGAERKKKYFANDFDFDDIQLDNVIESEHQEDDSNEFEISKRKNFDIEWMSEEEAVTILETLGHESFVFVNEENGKCSLAYKKPEEKEYGIITFTNAFVQPI